MWASSEGNLEVVNANIDGGANINHQNKVKSHSHIDMRFLVSLMSHSLSQYEWPYLVETGMCTCMYVRTSRPSYYVTHISMTSFTWSSCTDVTISLTQVSTNMWMMRESARYMQIVSMLIVTGNWGFENLQVIDLSSIRARVHSHIIVWVWVEC